MKRIISLALTVALLLGAIGTLSSCGEKTPEYETKTRTISYIYFNTVSVMSAYGDTSDEKMDEYLAVADGLLGYYHELFDIYYEYSGVNNLRTVNKNAGKAPVEVDAELIDFLEYCKEIFTLTDGKTNVMMGAVLRIWHNHRELADADPASASLPDGDELRAAATHTDIDSLVIDREAGTVYISDPEASIDVGAIGKGYATERLYERLREMGADSLALNIGGNLRTVGVKPDGEGWITGITNPDRESPDFAAKLSIGDTACVTSGDYERYYVVYGEDGQAARYHHIIDPDTLYPAGYFSSVTVVTADSALADALSTALFCLDYTEGTALLDSLDIEVGVLFITSDGRQSTYGTIGIIKD